MKKGVSKAKRFLTTALSLVIVLGYGFEPVSVYAGENEPEVQATEITNPITVDSGVDLVYENPTNVNVLNEEYAINVDSQASLELNGNVSLSNSNNNTGAGTAVVQSASDGPSSTKITGNVEAKGFSDNFGFFCEEGAVNGYVSSVDIGGSILSEGTSYTSGLLMIDSDVDVKVGEDIKVKGSGIADGLFGEYICGNVQINGKVTSESEENETLQYDVSTGVNVLTENQAKIDIGKGIISKGSQAYGADIIAGQVNDSSGNITLNIAENGIFAEATSTESSTLTYEAFGIDVFNNTGIVSSDIKGDVVVKSGNKKSVGIKIASSSGDLSEDTVNNIIIHGDLITDDTGIGIETVGANVNTTIVVEGTINSPKAVVLSKSEYLSSEISSLSFNTLDPTLNLAVWKVVSDGSSDFAEYKERNNSTPARKFESMVNYIIKSEQPAAGGSFALKDADGNDLVTVNDLEVAHEGTKIYVDPTLENGYVLKGIYNGTGTEKYELSKDEEGRYFLEVPRFGGVYLTMEVGNGTEPDPTSAPTEAPTTAPNEIKNTITVHSGENLVYGNPTNVNVSAVDDAMAINVLADSSEIDVPVETNDASIKLNGNVSLFTQEEVKYGNGTAISMSVEDGNPKAVISGNVAAKGYYTTKGIEVSDYAGNGCTSYVDVGGNIISEGTTSTDGIELYGTEAHVKVGKDIYCKGDLYVRAVNGSYNSGSVQVNGKVSAESTDVSRDGDVYALAICTGGKSIYNVGDGIISKGRFACGADINTINYGYDSSSGEVQLNIGEGGIKAESIKTTIDTSDYDAAGLDITNENGSISIDIKGDVLANSPTDKAVGMISNMGGSYVESLPAINTINIHGDIIADSEGIIISTIGQSIDHNIVVEGTIDAKTPVKFLNDCFDYIESSELIDELDSALKLTVWKVMPDENGNIALYMPDYNEDLEPVPEYEKKINYIIKSEQPSKGGTFELSDIDGNALATVNDLEVAHEGDVIYVEPELENGYVLKNLYNGTDDDKKELLQDEEGKYYLEVPKGGGVYLTMEVEKDPSVTPTPTPTPEVTPTPTTTPGGEGTPTPGTTPGGEGTPTPGTTPGGDATPSAVPSSQPTSGTDVTPTPATTPGGEVTPTPGTDVTPTPSTTPGNGSSAVKDKKTTFKIGKKTVKNKSKIKKTSRIKITDKDKIKSITLNGKKIKIKKNKTSFTLKLKSHKKKLRKKGKWNKLVVVDKNRKKTTLKFKTK